MAALFATTREAGQITVVDLSGRIALGEGSALLRKTIRDLLESGKTKIILNLGDINYIDSSGIGELVSGFTAVPKYSFIPDGETANSLMLVLPTICT